MNLQQLQDKLSGLPVPQIRYFESIGSSNDEALAWVSAGAEDGCLVVADQQTSGRGRFGRKWVTRPGVSLAFSLIVRPTAAETAHLGFFSPLGALAISQALEGELGLSAQIKWPNDVLLNERKAAGILVEAGWLGETLEGIVIGIGINITPEAVPPDAEVLFPATSVENAAGHPVDRLDLLRAVLSGIFAWRAQIGSPEFQQAWEARLIFRDKWVVVSEVTPGSTPIIGQVVGLAPDGGLVLRERSGEKRTIAVGDVHLRPQGD